MLKLDRTDIDRQELFTNLNYVMQFAYIKQKSFKSSLQYDKIEEKKEEKYINSTTKKFMFFLLLNRPHQFNDL